LGEHQLDKLGVTGSSPVPPTSRKPRECGVFWFLRGMGAACSWPANGPNLS
jgi:hypothetical protein